MRKNGSVCEFTDDRNDEMRKMFRRRLMTWEDPCVKSLFGEIARMQASRFFVSEMRVEKVLRYHLMRGVWPVKSELRRRMFAEIEERVMKKLSSDSGLPIAECRKMKWEPEIFRDAIFEVVNSPAPSFYLTARTCRTLLYETMNQRNRKERLSNCETGSKR